MNLKYYYYISESKVDMLESQFQTQFGLSGIKPEIGLAGISIGSDIKFADKSNLVRRTKWLIDKMNESNDIKKLNESEELDTSGFYSDDSIWFNGIFSFNIEFSHNYYKQLEKEKIFSYLLWKPWQNSIILLIGSPNNIIGEREIKAGGVFPHFRYSTAMEVVFFLRKMTESFTTDESDVENFVHLSDGSFAEYAQYTSTNGDIHLPKHEILNIPSKFIELPDALKSGIFCLKYLSHLPQSQIDTTFKVFQKMDFNRRTNLSEWAKELKNLLEGNISPELWKYKTIYIGSPLYTALA